MKRIFLIVVVAASTHACDSKPAPADQVRETSKSAPDKVERLAPPEPAPELKPSQNRLRFASKEFRICGNAADAVTGECSGPYARYARKVVPGEHVWIGDEDSGTAARAYPVFNRGDSPNPSGWVSMNNLTEAPDLSSFDATKAEWSKLPAADRSNLLNASKDALFRIEVAANQATPRANLIDDIPHPTTPLTLDYTGAPTRLVFRFDECLISGAPDSWISNHSCLLDATCAELQYVCEPGYCDEPVFIARREGGDTVPEMRVVAIADRYGTFACAME